MNGRLDGCRHDDELDAPLIEVGFELQDRRPGIRLQRCSKVSRRAAAGELPGFEEAGSSEVVQALAVEQPRPMSDVNLLVARAEAGEEVLGWRPQAPCKSSTSSASSPNRSSSLMSVRFRETIRDSIDALRDRCRSPATGLRHQDVTDGSARLSVASGFRES